MTDIEVRDQAALWMARARDPKFADWDALVDWLEANPAHNRAYEEAFAAHDLAGQLPSEAIVQHLTRERPRTRWGMRIVGGGLAGTAAAAAAIVALVLPYGARSAEIVAETRPGEHRVLRLGDGSQIALNGDSRVILSSSNNRTARIERGEALFTIVHNETRPFTVDAGSARMIDLGTRFNVVRSNHGSEVAVAEGAVLYDPQGAAVRLGPGRVLRKASGSPIVEVSQTDPALVGGWRSGHLAYRDAPLWRVAEDLSRATGTKIVVDGELAQRYFTGAFSIAGVSQSALRKRLAAVLDVMVAERSGGLYLRARGAQ